MKRLQYVGAAVATLALSGCVLPRIEGVEYQPRDSEHAYVWDTESGTTYPAERTEFPEDQGIQLRLGPLLKD